MQLIYKVCYCGITIKLDTLIFSLYMMHNFSDNDSLRFFANQYTLHRYLDQSLDNPF